MSIEEALSVNPTRGRGIWRRLLPGVLVLALAAGAYVFFAPSAAKENAIEYETAEVQRGNLTVLVSATGELKPLNQVDVGTEVSGTVKSVEVDYNDEVKVGQVLARLDTELLEAKYRQAQASLILAEAKVREAEATFSESESKLRRTLELLEKGLSSREEADTAEATHARATASLQSARGMVVQARAQVDLDKASLDKAVILSPISGVVLKRQVEPGQTVAASLQTPVLFTLAENLTEMELHVAVDEADVGQIQEGDQATFTVAAHGNRRFPATIKQVRYAPQVVNGVVTYQAILAVDNSDGSLRPGMTATADIVVKELKDVILVPNAALRFSPPPPEAESTRNGRGLVGSLLPRHWGRSAADKRRNSSESGDHREVWILQDGVPQPVTVTVGATDGRMSEIVSGDLQPGKAVIVDFTRKGK